jgi:hypothetical protein
MTTLFGRAVRIAAGPRTPGAGGGLAAIERASGFDLSNLDCVFHIKKSLKPEPNTCELRLFNLAESTRNTLSTPKRVLLRVEAGYRAAMAQLFLGEVRSARSYREGPAIVTELSTSDSEKEIQTARISFATGPNTSTSRLLTMIADALEVGIGNALVVAAKLDATRQPVFGDGSVLFGNAALALTAFCQSVGYEWSIQDGNLQILPLGGALETKGVFLHSGTGLIGSPAIDHKGVVSATALIQPDIAPGRYVQIKSLAFSGVFRVLDCEYTGDTRGQEWTVKFTGKAPKKPAI